jgi:hypothetical protein
MPSNINSVLYSVWIIRIKSFISYNKTCEKYVQEVKKVCILY